MHQGVRDGLKGASSGEVGVTAAWQKLGAVDTCEVVRGRHVWSWSVDMKLAGVSLLAQILRFCRRFSVPFLKLVFLQPSFVSQPRSLAYLPHLPFHSLSLWLNCAH